LELKNAEGVAAAKKLQYEALWAAVIAFTR